MELINRQSPLWLYISEEIRGLLSDGEILYAHAYEVKGHISDYSYLVFPFSKAYEGFLKYLFLDLGMIREDEYYGDDIRIGRILNPNYMKERGSVFSKLCGHKKAGALLSRQLWNVWRGGRNQVFHYFPHNFRRLSFDEASTIIHDILEAMGSAVTKCDLQEN